MEARRFFLVAEGDLRTRARFRTKDSFSLRALLQLAFFFCCASFNANSCSSPFNAAKYAFSELYKEVKENKPHWDCNTFYKEKEEELHDINIMTVKLTVSEGLYQCGRCKSKKTFSRQVQTRSADEGMTSIIQCSECNKVWREYA